MKRLAKFVTFAVALVAAVSVVAAPKQSRGAKGKPAAKEKSKPAKTLPPVPVAEGFPDWTGFETEIDGSGRSLTPSDLRLRYTIVVEIKGNSAGDAVNQFKSVSNLQKFGFNPTEHVDWNFGERRRDVVVVYNIHGANDGLLQRLRSDNGLKKEFSQKTYSFYTDVTFKGCPDPMGTYPFVYVMPPVGTEAIFSGKAVKDTAKKVESVIKKDRAAAKYGSWRNYYGFVQEVNHVKGFDAAIAGEKALVPVEANLVKMIQGKSAEAAKEAQMLYDALQQHRNELEFRASKSYAKSPLSAMYDIEELSRRWPAAKKDVSEYLDKASSQADAVSAYKAYEPFRKYADAGYVPKSASDASKAAAELQRAKPVLERLKDSKNINVQNAVFTMLQMLETLPGELTSRVPQK